MYFDKFPKTVYDQRDITNIAKRVALSDEIKSNGDLYFQYRVTDGQTPESISYDFYGDASMHWTILLLNDIVDPYYGWVLDRSQMVDYLTQKYGPLTDPGGGYGGVHHWEYNDVSFQEVKYLSAIAVADGGSGYAENDLLFLNWDTVDAPVLKVTGETGGIIDTVSILYSGVIADTPDNPVWTTGGSGVGATFNLTLSVPSNAVAVSNQQYEEDLNEQRRNIKLFYSEYMPQLTEELEYLLK